MRLPQPIPKWRTIMSIMAAQLSMMGWLMILVIRLHRMMALPTMCIIIVLPR